jgi:NADH pyrophosphatase NudC (nudix superfamily)
VRETCFRCKYADFKTQLDTPMHAFAKCAKARNEMEKATYYPRTNPCVTGAFQTASEAVIARRTAVLGEYPPQCAKFEQEDG